MGIFYCKQTGSTQCIECGESSSPHVAKNLCKICYKKLYRKENKTLIQAARIKYRKKSDPSFLPAIKQKDIIIKKLRIIIKKLQKEIKFIKKDVFYCEKTEATACKECHKKDRPHMGHGLCKNCYQKKMNTKRRVPRPFYCRHTGSHQCLDCKRSDVGHEAQGLCAKCYYKQYREPNKDSPVFLSKMSDDLRKKRKINVFYCFKTKATKCLRCKKDDTKHRSKGMCRNCYYKNLFSKRTKNKEPKQ